MEFKYAKTLMKFINVNLNIGCKQYDDNVLDYWKIPSGTYIVKMKKAMV